MIEITGVVFYTTAETAAILGVTARTLHRWVHEERPDYVPEFKAYTAPNGKKLYRETDIQRIVQACLDIKIEPASFEQLKQLAHA